jgi:hypothetical protein
MSLAGKIGRTVGVTLLYLVGFDILGVIVSFALDILPLRALSVPLFYAVWFVLGVFCGLLGYNRTGAMLTPGAGDDWINRDTAVRAGRLVAGTMTFMLLAILVGIIIVLGDSSDNESVFVPDNVPLTVTFLIATAGAVLVANRTLKPADTAVASHQGG